jgi:predicted RNA binding protein YcfA (HicA-like mRNA interferase family)
MTRLPIISGKDLLRVLKRLGYSVRDQKGSHVHLRHLTRPPLTVPMHDELDRGTLKAILRAAGLTPEELLEEL